jgi:peptidoglycan/xylan/chitin deacetylase (PgdA/CDA1 family)
MISFTFDDAPRSAFVTGGGILKAHNARATFFVSFGLLGLETEVGRIASEDDVVRAIEEGHEIGCHTFDHLDTWETSRKRFIKSVDANDRARRRIVPATAFKTFSYPKSEPKPWIKAKLQERFLCCRGGGQTLNAGQVDLNLLKAYFLDRRNNAGMDTIKTLIDNCVSCAGWLIFATHDITDRPSPYGCTPEFFQTVVEYAAHSEAVLLPVAEAYAKLGLT